MAVGLGKFPTCRRYKHCGLPANAATHTAMMYGVLEGDQRNEAILPDEGVVIARGQLEPLRVQDRDTRVEKRQAGEFPPSTVIRSPFFARTS